MIDISNLELYNKFAAIEHVKSLAFNRTALSVGETEALNFIEKELTKENIQSHVEYFEWTGPTRILMRTSYLIIITYLLLTRLFLFIIAFLILKNSFETFRRISFVKKEESKNIYVNVLAKEKSQQRPLVIFSAHYDSVSTNIPYRIQVIIFLVYRFIIFIYSFIIFFVITSVILDILDIFPISDYVIILITVSSLIGLLICVPILYLIFNEKVSSGSIDNASGVSILIELVKIFKKNSLQKMDLIFLWTGAEEWGLKGSKKFCERHFNTFNQKYNLNVSMNINIDMVGTYIGLLDKVGLIRRKKINNNLNDILEATAKTLNIPIVIHNKVIEPKSDHKSFQSAAKKAKKDFQVSYFHSEKDTKFIHSLKDTPDKCSAENLNGCLQICYNALKSIDLRIE